MESQLAPVVEHLRAGVYTCAAGGTILIYDILLTSKDEIRLIWPSRMSPVKFLYLVVRPSLLLSSVLCPLPLLESIFTRAVSNSGNVPCVRSSSVRIEY